MTKKTTSTGPSQRQLRVGEEVRHILSQSLARGEFYDEAFKGVTITIPEVQISPDLRHAKVYIYPIGGHGDVGAILEVLNHHAGALRTDVAKQMTTKYIPRLFFRLDKTFEEAAKIETLLRDKRVTRDLERFQESSHDEDEPS